MVARLSMTKTASKTLDLQYYIWHKDLTGSAIMHKIIEAADRGVRVRLLLDDLNNSKYEKELATLDGHPKIEVRLTNPFSNRKYHFMEIGRFEKVNRRMHNKVYIADNQVAVVGGRNLGDEYFNASHESNFTDFDLWVIGPAVNDFSNEFDLYWNSSIAYPINSLVKLEHKEKELAELKKTLAKQFDEAKESEYAEAIKDAEIIHDFVTGKKLPITWSKATVVYDPPEKLSGNKKKNLSSNLIEFKKAKKELILVSPYFVPGEEGIKTLKKLRKQNVEITILTNSLASNDVTSVFAGYRKYRKDLIEMGAHVYELAALPHKHVKHKQPSGSGIGLHAKMLIVDRKKVFVGSMNLDPRSRDINTEMGVVVESETLANGIIKKLKEVLPYVAYQVSLKNDKTVWIINEDGKWKRYDSEPNASQFKKLSTDLSSLFIPESML